MLRVLEHYFDDDADVGPRLAAIRSGSGRQDLANDLEQLADLYGEEDVHTIASKDPKHWRKDDVASARRLAQSIFRASDRRRFIVQRAQRAPSCSVCSANGCALTAPSPREVPRSHSCWSGPAR